MVIKHKDVVALDLRESKVCRPCKGSNLLEAYDTYVAIDIETTGLSPFDDEIIEIGAVLIDNGIVVDSLETLINPGVPIPPKISQLTGITTLMVASAPSPEVALGDFVDFIGNYPLVGHNVNFDVNFLYDKAYLYLHHAIKNDFVDTLRLARRAVHGLPDHKLGTLLNYHNIEAKHAHRALDDAENTAMLYEQLKQYIWCGEVLPESRAFGGYTYDCIYNAVKYIVDDCEPSVSMRVNKNYASIFMFGTLAFTIRINSRTRALDCKVDASLPFVNQISGAVIDKLNVAHFPIATSAGDVCAVEDMIRAVYDACSKAVRGDVFGCCNDFVRCSDAGACLKRNNPEYSGCLYRKNLEAGRIFYGMNKTI